MTETANLTIATPSAAWQKAEKVREIHRWLCEISRAIRGHDERFLPKEPSEPDKAYDIRRKRSILFPNFPMALRRWVGRVISEEMTWDVPPQLVELYSDIDLRGRALNMFLDPVYQDMWKQGGPFVLVESTAREGGEPFWVLFESDAALRVVKGKSADGAEVPKRIHLRNNRSAGIWGTKTIESVRVLLGDGEPSVYPDMAPGPGAALGNRGARFEFWDKNDKNEWAPTADPLLQPGRYPEDEIPGFLFEFGRCDRETGAIIPHSEWLGELCLFKYNEGSDHNRLMRLLRQVVLYWAGATEETVDTYTGSQTATDPTTGRRQGVRVIPMGAFNILCGDKDSSLEAVDATGAKADLSFRDLELIDAMIRAAELTPINPDKVQTLGEQIVNVYLADATLRASAVQLKDGVEELMKITAARKGLSEGGTLRVPTKFTLSRNEEQELARAVKLWESRGLSWRTLAELLQRSDPQFESLDIEQEMKRLADEEKRRDEQAARRVKAFADGPPMGEGE